MRTPCRDKPILLTGATGFVGQRLLPVLDAGGWTVRCASRHPDDAAREQPRYRWVGMDVEDPASMVQAMEGCGAIVYLVHRMGDAEDYLHRELQAARELRAAAAEAGIGRIVYLGGVEPQGEASQHLASRLETGRILRDGPVPTVELRASMIIGAGSESWRIVRDLAVRMPVQVLPPWAESRSQPVAIDDVCTGIAHALEMDLPEGSVALDVPGPETLSAREILERVAQMVDVKPVQLEIPAITPGLSSWWLKLVTRADYGVARELIEGLTADLMARDEGIWKHLPHHRRIPFEEAARRALQEDAESLRLRDRLFEEAVKQAARPLSLLEEALKDGGSA